MDLPIAVTFQDHTRNCRDHQSQQKQYNDTSRFHTHLRSPGSFFCAQHCSMLIDFKMNGQPNGLLPRRGPIDPVASPRRNKQRIPHSEVETFPDSLKAKRRPATQDGHPFRRFRTKPFAFRGRLTE